MPQLQDTTSLEYIENQEKKKYANDHKEEL